MIHPHTHGYSRYAHGGSDSQQEPHGSKGLPRRRGAAQTSETAVGVCDGDAGGGCWVRDCCCLDGRAVVEDLELVHGGLMRRIGRGHKYSRHRVYCHPVFWELSTRHI